MIDLDIFEPDGDRVGRVRDVVLTSSSDNSAPEVIGIVMEDNSKKRLFVRMSKVENITNQELIIKDLENVKRFEQRGLERLVAAEVFDRQVSTIDGKQGIIEDISFAKIRDDYFVTDFFIRENTHGIKAFRKGNTRLVPWQEIVLQNREAPQAATQFLEAHAGENPADFASALVDLHPKRRLEIAHEMSDERLALVLAQMNEDDQVEILAGLQPQRVVSVLHEMEPDDAADLVHDLGPAQAEVLLSMMEPDDAAEMRRLLSYDQDVAGALMTPVPLILSPEATVAEALAHMQEEKRTPAHASIVYICRPPIETPTGKYLGYSHFQQLLRTPPGTIVGEIINTNISPVTDTTPIGEVVRRMATYDLVSIPVVNSNGSLVGSVAVDDVLDHILPDGWRDQHDIDENIQLGEIR
ncbi:MAG: CBS domain-containing protein [Micrococcaceae bacterium]